MIQKNEKSSFSWPLLGQNFSKKIAILTFFLLRGLVKKNSTANTVHSKNKPIVFPNDQVTGQSGKTISVKF